MKFDDLILSLNQALDYAKGDKTQCRSMTVDITEDEDDELMRA